MTGITECGEAKHEGRPGKIQVKALNMRELGAARRAMRTVNFGAMTSGE